MLGWRSVGRARAPHRQVPGTSRTSARMGARFSVPPGGKGGRVARAPPRLTPPGPPDAMVVSGLNSWSVKTVRLTIGEVWWGAGWARAHPPPPSPRP